MKLINTKKYLLWVDETRVPSLYDTVIIGNILMNNNYITKLVFEDVVESYASMKNTFEKHLSTKDHVNCFVIIGHLPLSDGEMLDGVLLLPELVTSNQAEINKAARACEVDINYEPKNATFYYGFIKGYKAATSNGIFTLDDMMASFEAGETKSEKMNNFRIDYETFDEFMESRFRSKLPIDFEPEYVEEMADEDMSCQGGPSLGEMFKYRKTRNTPSGEQLIGKYIYE